MRERVTIDREEQETMKGRVREVIAGSETYDEIRRSLENLGFRAKEDNPALGLWEDHEHELFVMVHADSKTGRLLDSYVRTFEEAEGYD